MGKTMIICSMPARLSKGKVLDYDSASAGAFSSAFVLFVMTARLPAKQSAKQIPIAKFLKMIPQIIAMAMNIAVLLR